MSSASRRLHYAWIVLGMGTLAIYGALGMARFGYTALLPSMQTGLALDNTQAGLLATANLVGYLALSAMGGALAAHYGPRRVASLGLLLAGLGMLGTGTAQSLASAVLWRAITGVGSGAANISVLGMVGAWFAARRRGLASGIAVAGSSIGLITVGPLVPAILATRGEGGWRLCWLILGAITLVLALASALVLRNRPAELGLPPLGATAADPPPAPSAEPLHWGRVYRAAPIWHLGLVYVAFGFSYIIYMTFFSKRLIAEGEYTSQAAGALFMLMGWFSLACGLLWGTLSDRIGRKRALVMVYLIHAVAFGLFALWPTPAGFTLSAILFGLSAWSIPAIMAATCGDVLGPRLAPAALGFITLFFGVGQALGPTVAGAIADATGSFFGPYLLAAGVALLGAAGAAMLHPASTGETQ